MAFVPSDLSSIIAWWRGEDIPSGGADPLNWDDVVSSWRLSASGTARPTYAATAIGGLPGLDFDGTDDILSTTTAKALSGQVFVALVYRIDTTGDRGLFNLHTSAASPNADANALWSGGRYLTADNYFYYDDGGSKFINFRPVLPLTTDSIITSGRGPGACGLWLNGSAENEASNQSTAIAAQAKTVYLHLGKLYGGSCLDGKISECVIWTEPYDAIHRNWIEGYLAHKYSITLPTWHQFYAAAPTSGPSTGGGLLVHGGMNGGFSA